MDFNAIPVDIRTPGAFIEIDASRASSGLPLKPATILVIGQKLAAGTAAANAPVRVASYDQAVQLFGRASQLARMFKALKAVNDTTETWASPLADDAAGVMATKTLTFAGTATAAGSINLYIGGSRLLVAVADGDTAAEVATAVEAAADADLDLAMTAGVVGAVVTLTARHKGEDGNSLDVRANFYTGETLPAGITLAIADGVAGATNPDVTDVFTAIGDQVFDFIALPWTDAANLNAMDAELEDRWGPMRMLDGLAFAAARGSYGTLATLGDGRNGRFVSIIGANASPTPCAEWAAAYTGVMAYYGSIDPARPFQTLALGGVLAPAETARFTRAERDLLLRDGISTFTVDSSGVVKLERPITTWQTNAYDLPDTAFLDVNTPLTLSYLRWSLRFRILSKFPRHKLASDGADYGPGQAIVTPRVIKGEIVALGVEWFEAGLIENIEQFKRDLIVERDASDPNRVNALIPPDVVNQFRVFAGQIQFRL